MKRIASIVWSIGFAVWMAACSSADLQASTATKIANCDDLSLSPNSYWNGSDGSGHFSSGGAVFNNNYSKKYSSWDGWAYSNVSDNTTKGWANQYSAITGADASGSGNYAVCYISSWSADPTIALPTGAKLKFIDVTNTTYAYYDMKEGSGFSKKFGGVSGNDPDYFKLTITGNYGGAVEFYLADYRFSDNSQDYIVHDWARLDLSSLSGSTLLTFSLESSDNGGYGMNTPSYFAVDNLTYTVTAPEPSTFAIVAIAAVAMLAFRRKIHRRAGC